MSTFGNEALCLLLDPVHGFVSWPNGRNGRSEMRCERGGEIVYSVLIMASHVLGKGEQTEAPAVRLHWRTVGTQDWATVPFAAASGSSSARYLSCSVKPAGGFWYDAFEYFVESENRVDLRVASPPKGAPDREGDEEGRSEEELREGRINRKRLELQLPTAGMPATSLGIGFARGTNECRVFRRVEADVPSFCEENGMKVGDSIVSMGAVRQAAAMHPIATGADIKQAMRGLVHPGTVRTEGVKMKFGFDCKVIIERSPSTRLPSTIFRSPPGAPHHLQVHAIRF